jgi:hypothetical protein
MMPLKRISGISMSGAGAKAYRNLGMLHIYPKVVDTFFEYSTAKAHQYISPAVAFAESVLTGS